eukprot:2443965-Lingulodinium_polyedra.AAC.1
MMRSNRPSATTTAHKTHASHTPCEHHLGCLHGARDACDARAAAAAVRRFDRIIEHGFEHLC